MKLTVPLLAVACALATIVLNGCRTSANPNDIQLIPEDRIHIRAAWSPDGRTIVFHDGRPNRLGLYLVDSSGANLRLLYAGDAIGATWSPDNQSIAFSLSGTLYKIQANGTGATQLSLSSGSSRPAWSRDGRRIAFVRGTTYVLDLQSGAENDLLLAGDYPSWHPNTVELVVQQTFRDAVGVGGLYRFYALNPATLGLRLLVTFTSGEDCAFSSISPKGDAILYGLKPSDGNAQVWKVSLSTSQHTRLTDDSGDYPAWSPDGNQIVYTRTQVGDGGLWIMNADGTGKRRLTRP